MKRSHLNAVETRSDLTLTSPQFFAPALFLMFHCEFLHMFCDAVVAEGWFSRSFQQLQRSLHLTVLLDHILVTVMELSAFPLAVSLSVFIEVW